ncbi:MAG: AAA family ATPase, partial [Gammaproteobacteria bacterium]
MIARSEEDKPLSAYYQHYGCDHDPFPEETDEILHLTPDLEHRLELIRHLLEYSDHLLLVSGQAYAGKTALCDLLCREADENWSVCKVTATDQLGVTSVINSLLEIDDHSQRAESHTVANTNDLFSWLRSCDRKQIIPVLLLDDAHKLNDDVLVFILQLGQ